MDEDEGPAVVIKRRPKSRPAAARSTLSTSTSTPLNDVAQEPEEEGNIAVVRKKKSTADKVKAREGTKKATRLSFGTEENGADGGEMAVDAPARPFLRAQPSGIGSSQQAPPAALASSTASKPSSLYSADYLSQLRSQTLAAPRRPQMEEEDDDATPNAELPTANAIAAARMKRETMRKIGAVDGEQTSNGNGFISLDVAVAGTKKGESRLVREEDEMGEGDDDMADFTGASEQIPLGRRATQTRLTQQKSDARMLIDDAEADAMDEEDEEAMEWEAAQVRRAGGERRQGADKSVYRAAAIPQPVPLPTLDAVQQRLKASLNALEISHSADDDVLQSFEAEVGALEQQDKELRDEVVRVNGKYEWFKAFFEWVEDVAAFLDAKYPRLERIERDNLAHQKERLGMLQSRRYADDSDDVALFTGAAVQSRFESPLPADSDEPAPPRPAAQGPHSEERHYRRLARTDRKADSADETLEDDAALDLVRAVATSTSMLAELFADVESAEFRDPGVGVRPRFEDWRRKYPDEFGKAFGTLAMVGVWEFWARAEMGVWNPFAIPQWAASHASLERYGWHGALAAFSHHDEPVVPGVAVDDTDPVHAIVESVVLPRLQLLAADTYDAYSATATRAALALVEEVSYSIDRKSQKFEALVSAFFSQIYKAVSSAQSLILPYRDAVAAPLHALDTDAFAARERFARRQLLLATQALRWKRYAKGILVRGWSASLEDGLARELIGKVVLPVLEAGWTTGGREVAEEFSKLFAGIEVSREIKARLEAA